jgi:hypothetical protein
VAKPIIARVRARLWATFATLMACAAAPAAACDASFPNAVEAAGARLVINGQGWRIVSPWGVRAYAAALYQPSITTDRSEALRLGRPWAVEMVYCREAPVAAIRETWLKSLRANCGADCALDGGAVDAFLAALRDARPMARWRFLFDGRHVAVLDGGASRGAVVGAAFARTLLATWIGEAPPTTELRDALLGRR